MHELDHTHDTATVFIIYAHIYGTACPLDIVGCIWGTSARRQLQMTLYMSLFGTNTSRTIPEYVQIYHV